MKKKLVMKKFLMWSLLRCCDFGFIRVFEWSIQKLKTDQCEQLCTYPFPKVRCWYWSKKDYHDLVRKCRWYTFFSSSKLLQRFKWHVSMVLIIFKRYSMILPKKLSGKTRVQLSRSARNWPMEEIISCLPWAKVVCVCLDRILAINIMSVELVGRTVEMVLAWETACLFTP